MTSTFVVAYFTLEFVLEKEEKNGRFYVFAGNIMHSDDDNLNYVFSIFNYLFGLLFFLSFYKFFLPCQQMDGKLYEVNAKKVMCVAVTRR